MKIFKYKIKLIILKIWLIIIKKRYLNILINLKNNVKKKKVYKILQKKTHMIY